MYFGGAAALDSWGIAKSVKARDFDSRIAGSIPAIPAIKCETSVFLYDPVAQLVEHLPFKPVVRGSSPRRVTKMCRQKRCTAKTPHFCAAFLHFSRNDERKRIKL